MKSSAWIAISIQLAIASAFTGIASAHLFPIRSDPRVGRTISKSPAKMRIWFNGEIEAASSKIKVYNAAKQQVDNDNCRVSGSAADILEVSLPPLPLGTYRVYYKVLGKDKHIAEGDYSFILKETRP